MGLCWVQGFMGPFALFQIKCKTLLLLEKNICVHRDLLAPAPRPAPTLPRSLSSLRIRAHPLTESSSEDMGAFVMLF